MKHIIKSIFLLFLACFLMLSYSSIDGKELKDTLIISDDSSYSTTFYSQKNLAPILFQYSKNYHSSRNQSIKDFDKNEVEQADLVIFSFDRPLQLYALLESVALYMQGVHSISLIYRTSNDRYEKAYQEVQSTFPHVNFLKQEGTSDFKPLTLHVLHSLPMEHLLFAVDDNIVKDKVDLNECVKWMEKTQAYGFYLKLGSHLNFCYSLNRPQRNPPSSQVNEDIYAWEFDSSEHDWNYPNTLDMTLYRKKDFLPLFESLNYTNPNWLEYRWASWWVHHLLPNRFGLFYQDSKILNIPLNRVQKEMLNRTMNLYSQEELLEKFEEGLKLDVKDLYQVKNPSVHFEYEPKFILRQGS